MNTVITIKKIFIVVVSFFLVLNSAVGQEHIIKNSEQEKYFHQGEDYKYKELGPILEKNILAYDYYKLSRKRAKRTLNTGIEAGVFLGIDYFFGRSQRKVGNYNVQRNRFRLLIV